MGCEREREGTHRAVDIFTALLVLLLDPLLQEVDAELEAEVLLLQVVQVLGQSTIPVRHGCSQGADAARSDNGSEKSVLVTR